MRTLFLFLISNIALAQTSWVNVAVQTDNYGTETSWEIFQDSELVATSPAYLGNSYTETIVMLPPGGYNFVIYDSFGDGICCDFGEGYFGLSNICGLNTFVYDFNGSTTTAPTVNVTLQSNNFPAGNFLQSEIAKVDRNAVSTTVPFEQYTNKADIRLRGRAFSLKVDCGTLGVRWRLGSPRIDIRQDGRR